MLRFHETIGRSVKAAVGAHVPAVAAILALAWFGLPGAALAQDATWTGNATLPDPQDDWNINGNWSSGITPTGTAFFGTVLPPVPTTITFSQDTTIEAIRFSGTTPYTFDICNCFIVSVTGVGIVNNSSATQTFEVNGGALQFLNGSSIAGGSVVINNTNGGGTVFGNFLGGGSDTASAGNAIINNNDGNTLFFGRTTAGNAVITNQGVAPFGGGIAFAEQSQAGRATITNNDGGVTFFFDQSSAANSTIVNMSGGFTIFGDPCGACPHTATAGNATITNNAGGGVDFFSFTTAGNATILNSGNVNFFDNSTAGNATISALSGGYVTFNDSSTGGNARFITDNDLNSTVDFFGNSPIGGRTLTAGSIEGGGRFIIGTNNLIVGGNNLSTIISGAIGPSPSCGCFTPDTGTITKVGSGTLTFATGIDLSAFLGSLVVNGGTVVMDGDMSAAVSATVNGGGTLAGGSIVTPGILPTTFINAGGTLSPGDGTVGNIGRLGVAGNLQFAAGSAYVVDVAPTGNAGPPPPFTWPSDFTIASGPVALGGTLRAIGIGGAGYTVGAIYPVLATATPNTLNGSRFDRLFIAGDFGSTRPVITYDPLDDTVYLALIQGSVSGQLTPGATHNQISVASGIDKALLAGANFGDFTNLYNLTGDQFLKALDQLSGEAATGFQQAAYQSMGSFLNTLLNPWSGARNGFGPAYSFADPDADDVSEYAPRRKVARKAKQAMAGVMPLKAAAPYEPRTSVWGAAYGGSNTIDGDAVVGSHKTDVRAYGFAAGADFRVTPDALVGFALAGGRSSWGLNEGLGSGSADNFHIGAYGSLRFGVAYVSAAMAYGRHWVDTKRNVVSPGSATLEGDYDANSFGGRVEAGTKLNSAWGFGITPYAALQVQAVRAPSYLEHATAGTNAFAVQYNRVSDSTLRTELGSWVDRSFALNDGMLTLRGRAAWAHDSNEDRALTAAFPALPGSGFRVDGASPGGNLALLSAAAEFRYLNGVSLSARFDSELSDRSRAFSGTGIVRYVW